MSRCVSLCLMLKLQCGQCGFLSRDEKISEYDCMWCKLEGQIFILLAPINSSLDNVCSEIYFLKRCETFHPFQFFLFRLLTRKVD